MDKEIIDKKLKAQIDLFKIYSVFLIGLISGITGILLQNELNNNIFVTLLIIGFIFFIIVVIIFIRTLFIIYKLINKL